MNISLAAFSQGLRIEEGEEEEGQREECALGAGTLMPRDAVLRPRLVVGPAEGHASSAVLRPYICSPLGVGLVGGQGASCPGFAS